MNELNDEWMDAWEAGWISAYTVDACVDARARD